MFLLLPVSVVCESSQETMMGLISPLCLFMPLAPKKAFAIRYQFAEKREGAVPPGTGFSAI
jgi:hypothetical protein